MRVSSPLLHSLDINNTKPVRELVFLFLVLRLRYRKVMLNVAQERASKPGQIMWRECWVRHAKLICQGLKRGVGGIGVNQPFDFIVKAASESRDSGRATNHQYVLGEETSCIYRRFQQRVQYSRSYRSFTLITISSEKEFACMDTRVDIDVDIFLGIHIVSHRLRQQLTRHSSLLGWLWLDTAQPNLDVLNDKLLQLVAGAACVGEGVYDHSSLMEHRFQLVIEGLASKHRCAKTINDGIL